MVVVTYGCEDGVEVGVAAAGGLEAVAADGRELPVGVDGVLEREYWSLPETLVSDVPAAASSCCWAAVNPVTEEL